MSQTNLGELELAALLCSRVCHDVISPVGAIANGLEVLEDEKDEQMKEFAMNLIKKSATQASAKLQFARLAFGAAGSAGAHIDLMDAKYVSEAFVDKDKVTLTWQAPVATMGKNKVKLLLNLLLVALTTIPRGGSIDVSVDDDVENAAFLLKATGKAAKIAENMNGLLAAEVAAESIDARDVQVYYTGLIARAIDMDVILDIDGEDVTIGAVAKE
ncbi:MAG: histidine phosphotransferase [OCS116 cluster bacterium]|uniref:Histidine phosphotransferase n=1 Tax=OCS116 cluster bacterium TaxID=2030921 RepID=A0A2A4Z539_9PROT|nr:histidine phosphotransferase [OCS116 cluster bacterium]